MNNINNLHVEICLKQNASRPSLKVRQELISILVNNFKNKEIVLNEVFNIEEELLVANPQELETVESVLLECDEHIAVSVHGSKVKHFVFHLYYPFRRTTELEIFETEAHDDSEDMPSSNHWLLPSSSFTGLWENLIYEPGLKEKILKYALSALKFSECNINKNIISCNRLILLHGPPGTGKTSLCKALAQKLAIRRHEDFNYTHLIEINSHSLFSKWFSESGKLVMRLFTKIREILLDSKTLVCVLMDEVESLAYARDSMSGQEPKDAMRVVNALLTQLDSIRESPNVIILATSNLADTIDLAFLDRADIKQHIGLPSTDAIHRIYESMLLELMRVGIVREESLASDERHEGLVSSLSMSSMGLSGRALRKLPFIAHSMHFATTETAPDGKISLGDFLDAMFIALKKQKADEYIIKK